jgi:predicted ATPase
MAVAEMERPRVIPAVCNARPDLEVDVLEGMSSLVDQSLIRQVADDHGELRFAMLQTVREYALEHLDASGERAAVQRAHAGYCSVLAQEGDEAILREPRVTDGCTARDGRHRRSNCEPRLCIVIR